MATSPTRTATQTQGSEPMSGNTSLPLNNQSMQRSNVPLNSPLSQGNEICAASVKLPQFWTNCPEAWFIHAEMQFASRGVTQDKTKYEYVVTALPQEVIMTVLDVIQNPSPGDRYICLKSTLIERHSMSENRKLDKILSDSEIGDQKPSEYYRSLTLLAGSNFSTDMLRKLWIRKLPKSLNIALTGSNLTDTNELIRLADNLWEVLRSEEVASIRSNNSPQPNLEKVVQNLVEITTNMCESFKTLSLEVSSMRKHYEDRGQYQDKRYFRSRSRSRGRSNSRGWVCKFHYRYGSKARNCEQPCSYSGQTEPSSN